MNLQIPPSVDSDAGPGAVGDLLRASRLRHGQELADVARTLRIRTVYLQAIEDSRYEDLPGMVYAIGFIRSYADHLGLDGEQLVERFKADVAGQGRKPLLSFPVMVPENGIPRGAIISLGVLVLIAAYGGWYYLSTKDLFVADLIPPVPETITRALEAGRAGVAAVTDNARENVKAREAARTDATKSGDPAAAVAAPQSGESKLLLAPPAPVVTPAPIAPAAPAPVAALSPTAAPSAPPVAAAPAPMVQPSPAAADDAQSDDDEDEEAERTPPPTLANATPTSPPAAPAAPAVAPAPAAVPAPTPVQTAPALPSAKPAAPTAPVPAVQPDAAASAEAAGIALDDRGGVDAPATGSQLASLPGASSDPDREIVLKAVVDSWIQIRDATENKLVLTRLLRKGEQYTVPLREGLTLVTGNAGGLEVTVGGDATPSLGPIGVVRRNILLDPERLRAGTAIVE